MILRFVCLYIYIRFIHRVLSICHIYWIQLDYQLIVFFCFSEYLSYHSFSQNYFALQHNMDIMANHL
ncbi:hypothetical protein C2G38_2075420 [Gigaspora rosea]|uniref:Uncharacterized protein n=1 Tax=Gigaspora rosea TaxID=44941 RepID=A0A397VML0_9GLOM|nr:hypothetical protein C2G38_2075420 [Gigaspora rosea]